MSVLFWLAAAPKWCNPRSMRFADWLSSTRTTDAAFAAGLGCTRETVRRWRIGARVPDVGDMARIFEMTAGEVAPNDWAGVGPRSECTLQTPTQHNEGSP